MRAECERVYGPGPRFAVARAPYRVCPLGAHTDHQRGLVVGFAVTAELRVAFRPRAGGGIAVASREFPAAPASIRFDDPIARDGGYLDYLRGVAREFAAVRSEPTGIEAWIEGDLRPGGVASSAALEVAFLLALSRANGVALDRRAAMDLIVRAETAASGVQVGRLDPAVILYGEPEHAVVLDCAEGSPRAQRLARSLPRFEFVIFDVGPGRVLTASPYNQRVAECREAARALGAKGDPPALREITLEQLRKNRLRIDATLARRAEHVLSENKRVRLGVAALQQGDLRAFGTLVNASGKSMVQLFDAGTPETAALMAIVQADADVIGGTLNGAGFGGTVLAIVPAGSAATIGARVAARARDRGALSRCDWVATAIGQGASVESA